MASSSCSTSTTLARIPLVIATLGASYYIYSETIRQTTTYRRRQVALAKRAPKPTTAELEAGAGAGADAEGELEIAKEQFASTVIGGRYANCTNEWREQGAWEWMFWKLIQTPLTGRIWWDGGLPKGENKQAIMDATLPPCESPNFNLLFGRNPTPAAPASPSQQPSSPTSSSDDGSGTGLEMSWDHVAVPDLKQEVAGFGEPRPNLGPALSAGRESDSVTEDLTFTWIGQSTCFVQLEGVSILTDPVFATRTIPSALAPPRLRPPPAPLSAFTTVDLVLLSHDHFDHVHPDDVLALGNSVRWFVPLGMAPFLTGLGVSPGRVREMDWWETCEVEVEVNVRGKGRVVKRVEVGCAPAQHWSARSVASNQSLWASFVVKGEKDSFYHCGDTGYSQELFQSIGRVFGPITLAAIPIGAYCPKWHLSNQHVCPEGACQIHLDLSVKHSVGVHWGTWILSDERYDDPPKDLVKAREKLGVAEDAFIVVPPGRTLVY